MQRMRELREERGLTQVRLAVAADMNPATLNRIEQGKANPNLKTLERLAGALGVEVADLFPKAQSPLPEAEDERREPAHQNAQNAWYDYITQEAGRIASEADRKGYAPDWIQEIDELPRKVRRVLVDSGVLGKRDTYQTDAEWRQPGDIADALAELERSVEQAWRAQIREAEKQEQQQEAAAKLDSIWKRSKEADKSSKEALEAIRDERRDSA